MSSIDRVLALRAEILQRSPAIAKSDSAPPADFGTLVSQAVRSVSEQQSAADAAASALERGGTDDLAAVMIERQKSALAFQAVLQTRNKLLGAYRDIMNMPV